MVQQTRFFAAGKARCEKAFRDFLDELGRCVFEEAAHHLRFVRELAPHDGCCAGIASVGEHHGGSSAQRSHALRAALEKILQRSQRPFAAGREQQCLCGAVDAAESLDAAFYVRRGGWFLEGNAGFHASRSGRLFHRHTSARPSAIRSSVRDQRSVPSDPAALEALTSVYVRVAFWGAGFLAAGFLAAGFLAAGFLAAGFLAAGFFGSGFFAAGFFGSGFFAAGFFGAGFVAPGFFATGCWGAAFLPAGGRTAPELGSPASGLPPSRSASHSKKE